MGTQSDQAKTDSRDAEPGNASTVAPSLPDAGQYGTERSDALDEPTFHYAAGFMTAALSIPEPLEWAECLEQLEARAYDRFDDAAEDEDEPNSEDRDDDELDARKVEAALRKLFDHVAQRLAAGAVSSLIPNEQDAASCDEWIKGFADAASNTLHDLSAEEAEISSRIFPRLRPDETLSREAARALARAALAMDVSRLIQLWTEVPPYDPELEPARPSRVVPTRPFDATAGRVIHTGATFVRPKAKVGRNDLCPCGSGKKYKKCCG